MKIVPQRTAFLATMVLASMMPGRLNAADTIVAHVNNAIPRRDTKGNILDAHDGCLQKFGGRYYLYGTAYGKTDGWAKTNRYRCYSSPDLTTWKLEGELLRNPLPAIYFRPYVVYNARTRKYVLWYNWCPAFFNCQYGAAESDVPQGPFTVRNSNVKVSRANPGDLGLFVDADGRGYVIYTSIAQHFAVSIERLSDDYLDFNAGEQRHPGDGLRSPGPVQAGRHLLCLVRQLLLFLSGRHRRPRLYRLQTFRALHGEGEHQPRRQGPADHPRTANVRRPDPDFDRHGLHLDGRPLAIDPGQDQRPRLPVLGTARIHVSGRNPAAEVGE